MVPTLGDSMVLVSGCLRVPMSGRYMVPTPGCSSAHTRLHLLSRWALILSPGSFSGAPWGAAFRASRGEDPELAESGHLIRGSCMARLEVI